MSTNTNASNGASQKPQRRELKVSEVREEEIIEHIKNFAGDGKRIVVVYAGHHVKEVNEKDSGDPVGSNVNIDATGKQTTEELENGNSLTLVAKNAATLNRDAGKTSDRKTSDRKATGKKTTDRTTTEQTTDENNR